MPPGAARWHPTQRLPKEPASWMVVAALVCRGRRRRKSQASDGASFFQKHGQVVTENKQRRSHTLSFTGGLACLREAVCTWEFLMRNVHADSTHTCLHHGMLGLGSSRSVRCAQSRVADGMGQKREKREREREREMSMSSAPFGPRQRGSALVPQTDSATRALHGCALTLDACR